MANRKRQIPIIIMVNEREKALIEEKMRQLGTKNMGAYIRKMAIDGYVVRLDLSDISELVSLLRRSSNNLNQYAKRAHETGRIYEADIDSEQPKDCMGKGGSNHDPPFHHRLKFLVDNMDDIWIPCYDQGRRKFSDEWRCAA